MKKSFIFLFIIQLVLGTGLSKISSQEQLGSSWYFSRTGIKEYRTLGQPNPQAMLNRWNDRVGGLSKHLSFKGDKIANHSYKLNSYGALVRDLPANERENLLWWGKSLYFTGPYLAKSALVDKSIKNIVIDDENDRIDLSSDYVLSGSYSLNEYWKVFRNIGNYNTEKWKDEKWILPLGQKLYIEYKDNGLYINGVMFDLVQAVCVSNLDKLRHFLINPLEFDVKEGFFEGGESGVFNRIDSLGECDDLITNYIYRGEINGDEVLVSYILPFNNFITIRSKKEKGGFFHKNYNYWFEKDEENTDEYGDMLVNKLDERVFYWPSILNKDKRTALKIRGEKSLDYIFNFDFLGQSLSLYKGFETDQKNYNNSFKSVVVFFNGLLDHYSRMNPLDFYVKYGFVKSRLTDAFNLQDYCLDSLVKGQSLSQGPCLELEGEETKNLINKLISHPDIDGKLTTFGFGARSGSDNYEPLLDILTFLSPKNNPIFYTQSIDGLNYDDLVKLNEQSTTASRSRPGSLSDSNSNKGEEDSSIVTINTIGTGESVNDATLAALRDALSQAYGAFISSNTKILNDELVKDEIVAISSGNIIGYDILSQVKLAEGNYSVSVKARVSAKNFASYMQSKGHKVSFSGQSFGMKIKLQKLNEEAEIKAFENMIVVLKDLFKRTVDFEIKNLRDPVLAKCKIPYLEKYNLGSGECYDVFLNINWSFNENFDSYNKYMIETLKGMSMADEEIVNYTKQKRDFFPLTFVDMSGIYGDKRTGSSLPWSLYRDNKTVGRESNTKLFFRQKKSLYKFGQFFKDMEKIITNFSLVINDLDGNKKSFTPKVYKDIPGKGANQSTNNQFYEIKFFSDKTLLRYLDSQLSLPSPLAMSFSRMSSLPYQFDDFISHSIYLRGDIGWLYFDELSFPYNGYYGPWRGEIYNAQYTGADVFRKVPANLDNHSIALTLPLSVLENIAGFEVENLNY
tara:strand:- start:444 stop:3335 length:2892 start_codon:yes stop_codon:yes gene_type:complete